MVQRPELVLVGGSANSRADAAVDWIPRRSSVGDVACRVVCISHATGAGGQEVGRLVAAWAVGSPRRTGDELGSDEVRALIRETIEHMAARGKVVIVAHAASRALPEGSDALRVLVTASPAARVSPVCEEEAIDPKDRT